MVEWLRLSSHLKTSRPRHDILMISMTNKPYNLLDGDVLTELKRVFLALNPRGTRVVILTSGLIQWISHYDVKEILDFGRLIPSGVPTPPWIVRSALTAESFTASFGLRSITRRTIFAGLANLNLYHEVTELMRSAPQVFIAAINGRAFGGGCELALACDYRFMTDAAPEDNVGIGQPEILLGLIPGGGGTQMLSRILGPAKALELCLEGRLLSPQEAHQLGLVSRLVPCDKLIDEAVEFAKLMATRNPYAVAAVKIAVHKGGSLPLHQGMRLEQSYFGSVSVEPEAQVAMQKYVENVDHFLGDKSTLKEFEVLHQGQFSDLTPGSAAKAKKAAAQAVQQRKAD